MKCFACGYQRKMVFHEQIGDKYFIYIESKTLYDKNKFEDIDIGFYICPKCGTVVTDYNQE
jgi:rubredoxin